MENGVKLVKLGLGVVEVVGRAGVLQVMTVGAAAVEVLARGAAAVNVVEEVPPPLAIASLLSRHSLKAVLSAW